ncbi:MAG: hypothetical protein K0R98_395 [Rickettsiaceae bacterium]|jgi:hypothetical protein|nr:hypothetical protein [Rickettsiaceae bacterium]
MLNNFENASGIADIAPIFKGVAMSALENEMLHEQGFSRIKLEKLRLKRSANKEYHVFTNKVEFKPIEAMTAMLAMEKSEQPVLKIVNPYCRMNDIVELDKLEYVEPEVESATAAETSTSAKAAPEVPAADAPKTEENAT